MTLPRSPARTRIGFTLIELLTVVSIIGLLISILLPSLNTALKHARNVRIATLLKAVEGGLEMFRNDFNYYPDSSPRKDPITDWPMMPNGIDPDDCPSDNLSGAHLLARALSGHDGEGIDLAGYSLKEGPLDLDPPLTYRNLNLFPDDGGDPGVYSPRKGTYLNKGIFVLDMDERFRDLNNGPSTNRRILIDSSYEFPILYYRANPRAAVKRNRIDYQQAVYNQLDNAAITGTDINSATKNIYWDFARTGFHHGLGELVNWAGNPHDPPGDPANWKGKTFINYVHDHAAEQAGGSSAIRPVNPDSFILISPGYDGIFGTDDDINNFKSPM